MPRQGVWFDGQEFGCGVQGCGVCGDDVWCRHVVVSGLREGVARNVGLGGGIVSAQAMAALTYANEVRCGRAGLRREIRNQPPLKGREAVVRVLQDPPPLCEGMTLYHLLVACRGIGAGKAHHLCARAGASSSRRVNELTDRQRDKLTELLRAPIVLPPAGPVPAALCATVES